MSGLATSAWMEGRASKCSLPRPSAKSCAAPRAKPVADSRGSSLASLRRAERAAKDLPAHAKRPTARQACAAPRMAALHGRDEALFGLAIGKGS
jgi:hypothetical protein